MCVSGPKPWSAKGLQQEGLQRPPSGHRRALSAGGGGQNFCGNGGGGVENKRKCGRYRNRRTGPITIGWYGNRRIARKRHGRYGDRRLVRSVTFFLGGPAEFLLRTRTLRALPEDYCKEDPLQLPMGWGVGKELTKSWPTFEQLCVQNLALAFRAVFLLPKARAKSGWLEVHQELDMGWPTFDAKHFRVEIEGVILASSPLATPKRWQKSLRVLGMLRLTTSGYVFLSWLLMAKWHFLRTKLLWTRRLTGRFEGALFHHGRSSQNSLCLKTAF